MIYFVDEDKIQMEPFLLELTLRNFEASQILNADAAVRLLGSIVCTDFIFIDVMLAANPDHAKSAFTREQTEDYKTTGLRLAEMILRDRPDLPTSHLVLMSQAASDNMRATINSFSKRTGVRFIAKSAYDDPVVFGDEVEKIMKTVAS